nr:M48 family metallopeptidase [Pectobacterium sp. PL152]
MKTFWGTCNTTTKRIWLNLELVKKPPECLEYILVHELVHLLERHHNERFQRHMDRFIPNWRERRDLLNKMPLAFEAWEY